MKEVIAITKLMCISLSNQQKEVTVKINKPYCTQQGEWACPITMNGLHENLNEIRGEDSLQALCLGISLVANILRNFVKDGGVILMHGTDSEFPIDAYFSSLGTNQK